MGFNIGGFISGLAPLVGAAFGGPTGALLGAQVGTVISTATGQPSPVRPTVRANGAQVPATAMVGAPAAAAVPVSVGPTPVSGALVPMAARGLMAALLAKAAINLGKRVTAAQVLSLVRELGLAAAAAALGLTAIEVAQILASRPRRRRRGITAAQLSTTRRTLRKVATIQRNLAEFCPPARRRAPTKRITATRVQA